MMKKTRKDLKLLLVNVIQKSMEKSYWVFDERTRVMLQKYVITAPLC